MKKFYSYLPLFMLGAAVLFSEGSFAQVSLQRATISAYDTKNLDPAPVEKPKTNAEGEPLKAVRAQEVEEITFTAEELESKKFKRYARRASNIPGVTVKGYCDNEKVVVVSLNLPAYRSSVKSKMPVESLSREDLFGFLSSDIGLETGVQTSKSNKFPSEVERNCSSYTKAK